MNESSWRSRLGESVVGVLVVAVVARVVWELLAPLVPVLVVLVGLGLVLSFALRGSHYRG